MKIVKIQFDTSENILYVNYEGDDGVIYESAYDKEDHPFDLDKIRREHKIGQDDEEIAALFPMLVHKHPDIPFDLKKSHLIRCLQFVFGLTVEQAQARYTKYIDRRNFGYRTPPLICEHAEDYNRWHGRDAAPKHVLEAALMTNKEKKIIHAYKMREKIIEFMKQHKITKADLDAVRVEAV